ncbi:MAG: hypothetical protein ABIV94_10025 [Acidimicrobiales bacterium]
MDVDAKAVGLVLLLVATFSGMFLFAVFARAARSRERAIDGGAIATHGSIGFTALVVWFSYVNGAKEFGGARPFVVFLLAVVLAAGVLMLRTVQRSRHEDPDGESISEAAVSPMHILGHVVIGSLAIIAVVATAIAG